MAIDLHIIVPEDSAVRKAVLETAEAEQITAEEAAARMIAAGAYARAHPSPRRRGRAPVRVGTFEEISGLFTNEPSFGEAIAAVIASRAERYGLPRE